MLGSNLDNITQTEQMTDFDALGKVHLDGIMPYVNVLHLPNYEGMQDVVTYLDIFLIQLDGY